MAWSTATFLVAMSLTGQTAPAPPLATPPTASPPAAVATPDAATQAPTMVWDTPAVSGFLKGDTAFPRFIAPVSNPVFAKDPRASTYARFLFVNDVIPGDHPFGGGDFQAVALQAGVAVNERLTIIADKDGYAWLNPNRAPHTSGLLNLGAGLKYSFIRDVENQFILSGGFMYEIPSGESGAFSGHGNGTMTMFATFGKEWNENWHLLGTLGYQVPLDSNWNSSYYFTSLHLDYRVNCWFYPLVELNWFHWVQGGNRFPPAIGEVDGLINLGTAGVAGNDFVTIAVGGRFVINENWSSGIVWETPISNRQDFMNNRITLDVIFRY